MLEVSRLNNNDYMQSAYTFSQVIRTDECDIERVKVKYMERWIMKVQVNDSVCDKY